MGQEKIRLTFDTFTRNMSKTEGEGENFPNDPEAEEGTRKHGPEVHTGNDVEEEIKGGSVYDPGRFISGPKVSKEGTLNLDILQFDFSYGYDCLKYFNLSVLDENTVVFSSGNFINFFNVPERKITFRRSALGGGIGHIRKNTNPEFPYFAVAECGQTPIIIMYVWPSLEIVCVLEGGAEKTYANMDFNPEGELLVSQSGEPDFLITVWDWKKHTILLKTQSYINEVYNVKFSPYVAGQLTTCGMAHIKFWKIASSFTGLKLKGELGRFGKTEYSDIVGVLPMPDTKVVSGCSSGNILVWDNGLISFEVFRSLRRKCHDAPIVQFYYLDGELWTVSMDGHVKVWWFEKIDQADPPEDDRVILVDPTYDFYMPEVKLMALEKRKPGERADSFWYAQDGNGGIWLIDLTTDEDPQKSERLYTCHGGKVTGLSACPYGPYIATLGELGSFFLHNYVTKTLALEYTFPAPGTCLTWIKQNIDLTGEIILAGFGDGQVRVCCLHIPEKKSLFNAIKLTVSQVIKPHNKPITTMSLNSKGTILVTAGEDSTIFIFKLNIHCHHKLLIPIGFFPTTDVVTCITWHPSIENEVLVGCLHGHMMQIKLPSEEQPYTGVSFRMELQPQCYTFCSYKSQIKRNFKIQKRKAEKLAKKKKDVEQVIKDKSGFAIDKETLADFESEEELEPLFYPKKANRIIWLKYTNDNTIWLSMGGYDAGYIYECCIDQKDTVPMRFHLLEGADDMEVSTYVYTHNQQYLIFAMQDGSIRINKTNPKDYTDLSDYFSITMHDNRNGFVPKLCFSNDEKYLFSCGHDGNIFSYMFNPQDYDYPVTYPRYYRANHVCSAVKDVETDQKLSLEEVKIKAEDDKIKKLADEHKSKVRGILKTLKDRYEKLLLRNSELLPSQIVPRERLEPYDLVARYVDQIFHDKVNIVRRKLAFDVEKSKIQVSKLQNYFTNPCDGHPIVVQGINDPNCSIMTVRQRKMSPKYYEMLGIIAQKMKEEESKGRLPERAQAQQKGFSYKIDKTESPLEYFLFGLTPEDITCRLSPKLTRLLKKYRKRRMKWDHRAKEWEKFLAKKPIPGKNHPDDEKFLTKAKESFGDYKLKESPDYKPFPENRETTVKHYKRLLEARNKQYELRHNFIQTVFDIRDYKYRLIERLQEKQNKLNSLNEELPEEFRNNGPVIPPYNPAEFPEEMLQVKVVLPVEETTDLAESDDVTKPVFVGKSTGDDLEREIISAKTSCKFQDGFFQGTIPNVEVLRVAEMTFEELLNYPDNLDTPFESCLRAKRLNKVLLHQKLIISEMQDMIKEFNTRIYEARKERLSILVQGNFMDLFIICLNEELQILKSCEEQENKLFCSINTQLKRVHDMEGNLDSLKADKTNREIKLENLRIDKRNIQQKFKIALENNEFYEFLRKVFQPPTVKIDEESSSSRSFSSAISDSQDDSNSTDSKDIGFNNQDLNVCPKGCEQALFNFTVDLRSKRYDIEQAEKQEVITLDLTKSEIDTATKQLEILKRCYNESVENLEAFRREKQSKLNHVRCTVVLTLDQIYGRLHDDDIDISEFLVFSRNTLSGLYKRVKSLYDDSLEEQEKHDNYLTHLLRMRKDIIYMQNKALCLKQDIQRLLKIKFGKEVDIGELEMTASKRSFQKNVVNELEEVVLKKLVYELRINMADVKGIYIAELEHWQKEIRSSQYELTKEIKDNTRRLELLDVISKEKKSLAKFVDTQDKRREQVEEMEAIHRDFTKDLQKLQEIIEEQNHTLQDLREEIKLLKSKGMAQKVRNRGEVRELEHEKQMKKESHEKKEKMFIDYGEYITESDDNLHEEEEEEEEEAYEMWPELIDETIKGEAATEYYFSEGKDLVRQLVGELLKDADEDLKKKSTEQIIHTILTTIMQNTSIHKIINEIEDNLPLEELSEEQRFRVKATAERLMEIIQPQLSDENINACIRDILEETLKKVSCHDPHYLIPKILERLIEHLPLELIFSVSALDEIALTIKKSVQGMELDERELQRSIDKLPIEHRQEILDILKEILERIYVHWSTTATTFSYVFVPKSSK
ncbi:cilia- and flagella-associated protein 44 isoform X2 [Euwallacea fornicatus]|uniref:cilia- and flagella-associated protein 44 isoform X2 n=1 Tax=Euwallacea fornicatus TaxID=995702 RepID=UPI00338E77DD